MTLLNWELTPEDVVILSDTLALSGDQKRPRGFMTKVFPALHLNALITGTGLIDVVTQFYLRVVRSTIADDVVHLAEYAPKVLQGIWAELADQLPPDATTTIYVFGIAKDTGEFVGHAYRSTNYFEAEAMIHARAAKPAPSMAQLEAVENLADFVKLALHQQADDRVLPRMSRVGIGGDLWAYFLGKDEEGAMTMSIHRVLRMPHYEQDHELMLATLPENEGHPRSLAALALDP